MVKARGTIVENGEIALLKIFNRLARRVPSRYVDLNKTRVAMQNYATVGLRI